MTLAIQLQSTVIGWQVYKITGDVLSIGLIGLSEAIPFITLSFFTGYLADTQSRTRIIRICLYLLLAQAIILWWLSLDGSSILKEMGLIPLYSAVVFWGIIRGFMSPASQAFVSQLVPREHLANATTWNSFIWHMAAIAGPAAGGVLCAFMDFDKVYLVNAALLIIAISFFVFVKHRPASFTNVTESFITSIKTGIKFVFAHRIILGSLSLDMFAVLFGGAVAMLPAFADKVILSELTTSQELGILRASPAIGSVVMALIMAFFPPTRKAGRNLLFSVALFGLCIILFSLSESLILSCLLLACTGAFDNVSVVIRHTIIQLMTPDEMRGRVSAVNGIFIGSSNEIGSFESGLAASLMGLVPSVIFGGSMTILIVCVIFLLVPALRRLNLEKI